MEQFFFPALDAVAHRQNASRGRDEAQSGATQTKAVKRGSLGAAVRYLLLANPS